MYKNHTNFFTQFVIQPCLQYKSPWSAIQWQSSNLQGTHLINVDTFLWFKVTIRCANLHLPVISDYQHILHDKIKELYEGGLGYRRIAYWLNDNGYKTPKGNEFKNNHVHSILKKRRLSNKRCNKKYENEVGKLSMRFIDRTIVTSV